MIGVVQESSLKEICQKAIEKWGFERQANHLQEECGELIAAISHLRRKRKDAREHVLEEATDVKIMVEQILSTFTEDERADMLKVKLTKTFKKLADDE